MADHGERFVALCENARADITEIDPEGLATRLAGGAPTVVVDVREDHEWAEGRIPGAVHVGRGILEREAEDLWPASGTTLVLYCGGGYRSALAARSLQWMGYTKVFSLAGGRRRWQAEGRPWDTSPAP